MKGRVRSVGAVLAVGLAFGLPSTTHAATAVVHGQNSLTLEFGLGSLPGPFTLAVRWPSGATQTVSGIAANQHLVITEPTEGEGA